VAEPILLALIRVDWPPEAILIANAILAFFALRWLWRQLGD